MTVPIGSAGGSAAAGKDGGLDMAAEIATTGKKPKKSPNADRKIVTFGDSSSVVGDKKWGIAAIVSLLALWYVTTKAWGLPGEFKIDGLSDQERLTQCNNSDECGRDAYTQIFKPLQFPSIRDTIRGFGVLFTDGFRNVSVWEHSWASLWRVIRGLFWGIGIGVPVGMAMGLSRRARGFFDPLVELFRPIPPLALIALFIAFFGLGDGAAWKLLTWSSVFIMIIAARSGVQAANLSKVRAAYSLGASKRQVLQKVLLPNALPELFTGLRVSLGVAWGTLVAAELTGTSDGLGAMIQSARGFLRMDVVVVGIIIIAVLGVLMDLFLRFLESRLIPWRGKG